MKNKIEYRQIIPENKEIAKYVNTYTYSIGSIFEKEAKFITRAFPSYLTQIYFEFEGGLSEIVFDNNKEIIDKGIHINIGIDKWFDIYQIASSKEKRDVKNFKVDLFPHAIYEIFDLSPKKLSKEKVDIETLVGNKEDSERLWNDMRKCETGEEFIHTFERFLLKKISEKKEHELYISDFLNAHTSLKDLSEHVGYSSRWIQKKHKEIFGFTFKELQNNLRFLQSIQEINKKALKNEEINFSLLCLELGFFDQSHFINTFKKYTGMTPTAYLNRFFKDFVLFYW